jgi:hypothetical protein
MILPAAMAIFQLMIATGQSETHAEAVRLLDRMRAANETIVDMKCLFTFEVTEDGRKSPACRTIFRYRANPETIHMTFLDKYKGRKVLYIKGRNHGKMKVRPEGFLSFLIVNLDPLGKKAMMGTLDPITAQGFSNIIKAAEDILSEAERTPGCEISVEGNVKSESGTYVQLRVAGTSEGEISMLVDQTSFFPFRITKTKGNKTAVYTYKKIELNPGMSDSEFDLSRAVAGAANR